MSHYANISTEHSAQHEIYHDQKKQQLRKQHQEIVQQIKAKDTDETNHLQSNPDKVQRQTTVQKSELKPSSFYKPLFNWQKDDDQTFSILPTESETVFSSLYNTQSDSVHMLSILGYKIDISNQTHALEQKLQKYFIESRSHNELVGKFSELKFGIISSLLSLLGIKPNEIERMKKDALKKAIKDNINCFEQNEYNMELLMIFRNKKKDNSRLNVLTALQRQLIKQMENYDQPDFYTKDMIYHIKNKQVQKILDNLLDEQQNLTYLRSYQ